MDGRGFELVTFTCKCRNLICLAIASQVKVGLGVMIAGRYLRVATMHAHSTTQMRQARKNCEWSQHQICAKNSCKA